MLVMLHSASHSDRGKRNGGLIFHSLAVGSRQFFYLCKLLLLCSQCGAFATLLAMGAWSHSRVLLSVRPTLP